MPGFESIFGPTLEVVPVRAIIEKEKPSEDFLQSMQIQLVSMTQHERDGNEVAQRLVGRPQIVQSYLNWQSLGEDVLSKDLFYKNRRDSTVRLKPWRDLSTPFSPTFGVVLDPYDHSESIAPCWIHQSLKFEHRDSYIAAPGSISCSLSESGSSISQSSSESLEWFV